MDRIRLELNDVSAEQFAAVTDGEGTLEVILHCADGVNKAAIAVRRDAYYRPQAFIDVSRE